ncbi:MAG: pyridoxal-phosphate dependent enzyme [Planctomycetota bacterium]|nr:pyridoxal-phosphate dependent enzyme [Planctomycetota bacterium]
MTTSLTDKKTTYGVDIEDVRAAAKRIAPYAHITPIMTCATIDELAGRSVLFKCENFQKIGAFKFRGACNAIMGLPDDIAAKGVVTHSSGNHAQAVALAAKLRGIPAHIVMPNNSVVVKKNAVLGYGAKVYECEPNEQSRHEVGERVENETGATFVSPFDDPAIIAGQGTSALEFLDQTSDSGGRGLDAIITPIGGGGLISGTAITCSSLQPSMKIFGAEPKMADDAARSLAKGEFVPVENPQTIADGLRTSTGKYTWPIIRDHLAGITTVSEEDIVKAMRLVWERMKILIEPSSAVAVAAVLSPELKAIPGIDRIGIIISGGNVDIDHLPW